MTKMDFWCVWCAHSFPHVNVSLIVFWRLETDFSPVWMGRTRSSVISLASLFSAHFPAEVPKWARILVEHGLSEEERTKRWPSIKRWKSKLNRINEQRNEIGVGIFGPNMTTYIFDVSSKIWIKYRLTDPIYCRRRCFRRGLQPRRGNSNFLIRKLFSFSFLSMRHC